MEAKVTCFYRRRDLSSALIALADKHQSECTFESFRHLKCSGKIAFVDRVLQETTLVINAGFLRLLKSPGFLLVKYLGPGKSRTMGLVLESPGIF